MSTLSLLRLLTIPNLRKLDAILAGLTVNSNGGIFGPFWKWFAMQTDADGKQQGAAGSNDAWRALCALRGAVEDWLKSKGG